jgi:hypothetical protein
MSREVEAGATETRGAPGATLSREVGAGAAETRGAPGAVLRRETGAGAQVTRGGPGAALSREAGTTPLDNPHQMITRGKTGFWVVPDHLVLTAVISSLTPSPIPSSTRVALTDP